MSQDSLDFVYEMHQQAGNHLKEFINCQRAMAQALQNTLLGGVVSTAGIPTVPTNSMVEKPKVTSSSAAPPTLEKTRNDVSLRDAVLQVLQRGDKEEGLSSEEIAKIIMQEKIWTTTGNFPAMLASTLYQLKKPDPKTNKSVIVKSTKNAKKYVIA